MFLPSSHRCIRQRLYNISLAQDWKGKHKSCMGDYHDCGGPYSENLSAHKFCLVVPGQ